MKVDDVKIGMQVDFKVYDGDGDDDYYWETGEVVKRVESRFDVCTLNKNGMYMLYSAEMEIHDNSRFNGEAVTEPIQSYREDLLRDAILNVIGKGFVNGTMDGIEYLNMTAQEFWNAVHEKYEENNKKSKNQIV